MRSARRRSGVILVLVLLMIALCAAISSQIATRVIRLSGQAADAQKEAQHRWAAVSLRRTCLELAPALLTVQDGATDRQLQKRSFSILLSGNLFEVTVQDESAKLPIQRLLKQYSTESLRPTVRQLAGSQASLRAVFPKSPTDLSEIMFAPNTHDTSASLRHWLAVSERMTLWTDGKINARVASTETLHGLWRLRFKMEAPEAILALGDHRGGSLTDYLSKSTLTPSQAQFAANWLTDRSNTYSLWIDAPSPSGKSFTAIYVRRRSDGFADEQFGFHLP